MGSAPGWTYGYVPTAGEWNAEFASKQDDLGFVPLNIAGGTMLGELVTAPSSTLAAGFNLPPGTAPTSPADGDTWVTTSGLFVQINGATIGPIGPSSAISATAPLSVSGGVLSLSYTTTLTLSGSSLTLNLAHANAWTVAQAINASTGTLPAAQTGTQLQVGSPAGTATAVELVGTAAPALFRGVRQDGTVASPTAVQSGDEIVSLNGWGYNGAAIVGPSAAFRSYAAENWSSGHQGTEIRLATTAIAGTTLTDRVIVKSTGGVLIPGTVTGGDPGAGGLNATALQVSGVAVATLTDVQTLTNKTLTAPAINNPTVTGLTATTSVLGLVKPDGTTITISSGTISAVGGSATDVHVGTTTVTAGTTKGLLYDNAGVLGNLATANSGVLVTDSSGNASISSALPPFGITGGGVVSRPAGRLTLTSGVPVLTTTVSAAATVLYTPAVGNQVPLWDGAKFLATAFSELSNTLANSATGSAGPFAAGANAVYDLFVWNNAGTPTLTRGDMWNYTGTVTISIATPCVVNLGATHFLGAGSPVRFSTTGALPTGLTAGTTYYVIAAGLTATTFELSATVGGAAINTSGSQSGTHTMTAGDGIAALFAAGAGAPARGIGNGLTRVNGILVNASAITNGPGAGAGTYVGTIMTDSTGATVTWQYGSAQSGGAGPGLFGLWNQYNRRLVESMSTSTSVSWTYASTTIRPVNGSVNWRATFVCGQAEDAFDSAYDFIAAVATNGTFISGIGVDSITAYSGSPGQSPNLTTTGMAYGNYAGTALGGHFHQALESGSSTNTATITGLSTPGASTSLTFRGWF